MGEWEHHGQWPVYYTYRCVCWSGLTVIQYIVKPHFCNVFLKEKLQQHFLYSNLTTFVNSCRYTQLQYTFDQIASFYSSRRFLITRPITAPDYQRTIIGHWFRKTITELRYPPPPGEASRGR